MNSSMRASSAAPAATPTPAGPTNVTSQQVHGIDEGDIVKAMGDTLLVLRQGVLYSVSLDGGLTIVDRMRVQNEGGDERGWIDEMLVHVGSRRVVVTGFVLGPDRGSYTLYHLFEVGEGGQLIRGDAIYLRSGDYYSAEDYATRLVGDHLVAYSVHWVRDGNRRIYREQYEDLSQEEQHSLRQRSRWDGGMPAMRFGAVARFEPTWAPQRLYRERGRRAQVVHAVTSCDLTQSPVRCESRGVLAGGDAKLFVSETAAYLWMNYMSYRPMRANRHGFMNDPDNEIVPLYRFPHQTSEVQSVAVAGTIRGALSFVESAGTLRVVVQVGESPWGPGESVSPAHNPHPARLEHHGRPEQRVALVSIPVARFEEPLTRDAFTVLPGHATRATRFVGDRYLIYSDDRRTYIHDYLRPGSGALQIEASAERLDPLGSDGLLMSWANDANLEYLTLDLRGTPRISERRRVQGARTSETRTHGFFYRPDADGGSFAMPLVSHGRDALVAFFDLRDFRSRLFGELRSNGVQTLCINSCVDWYGNARPVFWQGRTLGLLGAELIEGTRQNGQLVETARVVLSPATSASADSW